MGIFERTESPDVGTSAFELGAFEEELPSGVVNVADSSVILLLESAEEASLLCTALASCSLLGLVVRRAQELGAIPYRPRLAIVEMKVAGAAEVVKRLTSTSKEVLVLAILDGNDPLGPALRAGAATALRRPLEVDELVLALQRLEGVHRRLVQSREFFGRQEATKEAATATRVSAALAHEIRNALSVATVNIQGLRDSSSGEPRPSIVEEREEMLRDTEEALARIDNVVRGVLGLARGERPTVEHLVLMPIAREVVANVKPNGVTVRVAGDEAALGIGNRALLIQVVENLVRNAVEAAKPSAAPSVLLRVYTTSGEARISVRDNGAGISAGEREHLFEPFFSTKGASGTGLGLAFSRHAVMRMGGVLTLSNEPPPGACFRVRLPRGRR